MRIRRLVRRHYVATCVSVQFPRLGSIIGEKPASVFIASVDLGRFRLVSKGTLDLLIGVRISCVPVPTYEVSLTYHHCTWPVTTPIRHRLIVSTKFPTTRYYVNWEQYGVQGEDRLRQSSLLGDMPAKVGAALFIPTKSAARRN